MNIPEEILEIEIKTDAKGNIEKSALEKILSALKKFVGRKGRLLWVDSNN